MIIIRAMEQRLLPRALAPTLLRALRVFSVVVIAGPRQVGKSTLVQETSIGGDRLGGEASPSRR